MIKRVACGAAIAVAALVGLGVAPAAGAAATDSYECAAVAILDSGHVAQTTCYRGPGSGYALQGTACGTSSCVTVTSEFVRYGEGATIDAGSAYIDQSTVHAV